MPKRVEGGRDQATRIPPAAPGDPALPIALHGDLAALRGESGGRGGGSVLLALRDCAARHRPMIPGYLAYPVVTQGPPIGQECDATSQWPCSSSAPSPVSC